MKISDISISVSGETFILNQYSFLDFVNNYPVIHKHEKTYDELFFYKTITPHSSFELIYPVKVY